MGSVIETRKIIRNRNVVDDFVVHLADDDPLPSAGDVTLSATRLRTVLAEKTPHAGRLGLRVEGGDDPADFAELLPQVDLVAVHVPKFSDGRYFSLARLIRVRHNYQGELRAIGDVLPDQLYFMQRVGFDSFDLRADKRLDTGVQALSAVTVTYQSSADDPRPLFARTRR